MSALAESSKLLRGSTIYETPDLALNNLPLCPQNVFRCSPAILAQNCLECTKRSCNTRSKILPITGSWKFRGQLGIHLYSFLTSALEVGGCSTTFSGCFPPWKIRSPLYRGLGEIQGRSEGVRTISTPQTGIRSSDHPTRNKSIYRLSYPGPLWGI